MKRFQVLEHQLIRPDNGTAPDKDARHVALPPILFKRLKRYDQRSEKQVFSWGDSNAKATQWVGVVQIPGLVMEILPKIEGTSSSTDLELKKERARSLKYLAFMLMQAGVLDEYRERDVTSLESRTSSLLQILIDLFTKRLLEQLIQGQEHLYIPKEENLHVMRGRLVFNQHIRENCIHRERFFVRHDEFSPNTAMNRIFKAVCLRLISVAASAASQTRLLQCLLMLEEVELTKAPVNSSDCDKIVLNRQNERFRGILNFSKLILANKAPSASAGKERTFALLFDMNNVFESFIANIVRKKVLGQQGLSRDEYRVYVQTCGHRKTHLLHRLAEKQEGAYRLCPDIIVERVSTKEKVIIDTKWKLLSSLDDRGWKRKDQSAPTDIYQLYAYARAYEGTKTGILLYPKTEATQCRKYLIPNGNNPQQQMWTHCIDIQAGIKDGKDASELVRNLAETIRHGFGV